jgi:hypothetical protein
LKLHLKMFMNGNRIIFIIQLNLYKVEISLLQ